MFAEIEAGYEECPNPVMKNLDTYNRYRNIPDPAGGCFKDDSDDSDETTRGYAIK